MFSSSHSLLRTVPCSLEFNNISPVTWLFPTIVIFVIILNRSNHVCVCSSKRKSSEIYRKPYYLIQIKYSTFDHSLGPLGVHCSNIIISIKPWNRFKSTSNDLLLKARTVGKVLTIDYTTPFTAIVFYNGEFKTRGLILTNVCCMYVCMFYCNKLTCVHLINYKLNIIVICSWRV